MSKQYSKLWVFGDSYTTPDMCVSPANSFWGLTASYAGIKTINNCSRPTNSPDTVYHLLITMSNQIDWANDLVIIGIPPLERITVFDDHKNTQYLGNQFDTSTWEPITFDIPDHRGLVCLGNFGNDRLKVLHNDRSWVETEAMRDIFLITKWLDSIDANYIIANLGKDLDPNNIWAPSDFLLPYCKNHPRCILFEKGYHGVNIGVNDPADFDIWGIAGHHGPAGNLYFFEQSFLPKLKLSGLLC